MKAQKNPSVSLRLWSCKKYLMKDWLQLRANLPAPTFPACHLRPALGWRCWQSGLRRMKLHPGNDAEWKMDRITSKQNEHHEKGWKRMKKDEKEVIHKITQTHTSKEHQGTSRNQNRGRKLIQTSGALSGGISTCVQLTCLAIPSFPFSAVCVLCSFRVCMSYMLYSHEGQAMSHDVMLCVKSTQTIMCFLHACMHVCMQCDPWHAMWCHGQIM